MDREKTPRKREKFPASEGWMTFRNEREIPIVVLIEPYGLGFPMQQGETFHVHVLPDNGYPSKVAVAEDCISIYCGDAIYRDGEELIDLMD